MTGRAYEIVEARDAAERIRDLVLRPADGAPAPRWEAGAHVRVALPDGGDRPYSLVDFSPEAGATAAPETLRLGVLLEHESRGGSRYMHGLSAGDRVTLSEPDNDFPLAESAAPPLLLAGGVGITPITAMAAALTAGGRDFELRYCGRSEGSMAYRDELAALCGERLRLHSDDSDPIDLAALAGGLDPARDVYVCGPKGLIEAMRSALEAAGHPAERLHVELFTEATAQEGDAPFEVVVASTGATVTVRPGQSIIDALEAEGVELMYDCRRGDCGICQTAVLEGEPDHRDVVLSDAERASGEVMQICVSRAKTPKLVLDL